MSHISKQEAPEEIVDGEIMGSGGELVVAAGLALTAEGIEAAERQIAALRDGTDLEGLDDARVRMEAWGRAAALHAKYAGMLRPIARLKILVEASIGLLDLEANGWVTNKSPIPLNLPSGPISTNTRSQWRLLGIAEHRGMLTSAIDALEDPSTGTVVRLLRRRGAMWVDRAALEKAWRDSGITLTELADAMVGWKGNKSDSRILGYGQATVGYARAVRVAAVLGIAIDGWDAFQPPPQDRSAAARRRWEANRALTEKERQNAIKTAVRKQGGAMAELYTMAERMQDVMGQAHREATDTEARQALSIAGTHYRKMRDEVVRALGVEAA